MERLLAGARQLGLELGAAALAHFETYRDQLLAWNRRVNLTAITDPAEVETRHFLDSLGVLALPVPTGARLVDVGAGGGFPGLPLAIARPDLRVVLVESVAKKAAFLDHVVGRLALPNVEVAIARAEELAHQPGYREAFDLAVARAVAELATLAELLLPFCLPGGRAIALKKGDVDAEIQAAHHAIELLGGVLRPALPLTLPGLPEPRLLVVLEKVRPTPPQYPRRPGVPGQRPLR